MTRRFAGGVVSTCLLLAGCAATVPLPTPSPSATAWSLEACEQAARGVGHAVQRLVDTYNTTLPAVLPPTAPATPMAGDPDLRGALDAFQRAVTDQGCRGSAVQQAFERGLADVDARGPVAVAVRARVLAGIGGRLADAPVDRTLAPGDSLAAALAEAPAGSTLRLAAGEHRLDEALVVLDAVTIRGAGRDATVLSSIAAEAAVLVVADGRVELSDLAVVRSGAARGSGVVAGGSASLVLQRVRVSRVTAPAGQGGAGVLLADSDAAASGRGTTLEVTDSEFSDNSWAGLAVTGGHRVSVTGSTFARNAECGVCFFDASDGSVSDGTFTDNQVGAAVTGTAHPSLLRGAFTGGQLGVQVQDAAAPTLDGNRITGASRAAVVVTGTATGMIARTNCARVPHGIVVSDAAAPTLVDNRCTLVRGA